MNAVSRRLAEPPDPKARLVSVFVGAVLLPSVALSVLSFYAVPRQARATDMELRLRAEKMLAFIEDDLERTAREHALEAAKVVGAERLLEGRSDDVEAALARSGFGADAFTTLRFEASSRAKGRDWLHGEGGGRESLRETLSDLEGAPVREESVPVVGLEGQFDGTLYFRFTRRFVERHLLRDYFQRRFQNPYGEMVVRVSEGRDGPIVYETAPTPPTAGFEVVRVMSAPSFRGLTLALRSRDRSIQDEVRRWALAKTVLIVFIDLMLGAGLLLVYHNVRREMRLSKLKSDFVANVSHELKTPLALIRLFSETLELGRVPGEDKKQKYYRVIHKESRRLTQLIDNILDFSRIEAGRREYHLQRADVARVVEDVLDAYRFQLEQQGFTLLADLQDDLPLLEVDKEALGQALLNIVNNAVKYSAERKHIEVRVRREDGRVTIAVADRGIGIHKAEQAKVFEKFYRSEDSLVHETRGSGLGLALVRHIMEAHGGGVELQSEPGEGSTFTLVLPLEPPARSRREAAAGPQGNEA
jgi:signal transduction histidine kinase